ncbi:hypothetical protein K1T71_004406 [Dendrolimus kikuchii]|uniref:Uncharacterized protein n=1 Tax=Dendrolimus kikuchii TaxID=765133 RepID=A0ACC1D7K0_9NEOP|nr:hypothetical protein K1T71_004406 [Dendrolimus kikuchii]
MYYKNVLVVLVAFSLLTAFTCAKKSKKSKPPRVDESFQPDVVAYSSFGFNDVGTNDGFVPSSPDYSSFVTGIDPETTTRLYGPAFPTALDSTGFSSNYASNLFNIETQETDENVNQNPGMLHYLHNSVNLFSEPSLDLNDDQSKNKRNEDFSASNTDERKHPVYGTKLNHKTTNKQYPKQLNNTEHDVFTSSYTNPSDDKFFSFSDVSSTYESKPTHSETNVSYVPNFDVYSQDYPTIEAPNYTKSINIYGSENFPTVVDFTNTNQFESTGVDIASPSMAKPLNTRFNNIYKNQNDDSFTNSFNHNTHKIKFHNFIHTKNNYEKTTKPSIYLGDTNSQDYSISPIKNYTSVTKLASENKMKQKKPWSSANITNYYKNWKDLSLKGYQYSTNNSHMTFKYNTDNYKKDSDNEDEVKAASSNLVDFTNYRLPEPDFAKFNIKREPDFTKIKPVVEEEEYSIDKPIKERIKQNEYNDRFQSFFSTLPTTTSSYWGNSFQSPEYFSIKNHQAKPQFTDDIADEFVTIPRAPPRSNYNKLPDTKFSEWSYGSQRPHRPIKPSKELFTRFKSEEDLLGLRNHDTSHPSYLPTFYPNLHDDMSDDNSNYKKLVDKWKESYLKAKYKDSALRDYENYAAETKTVHVPMPRPYPIEIPHPVIVPVPQPFPVRVPVSKPVAVPVVQEIMVPIEKPVPYPVIKRVPYPIEKPVPVRVEKEIKVPVPKPYPVHMPYVRPVFHHTRPHDEMEADLEENDYYPQSSKNNYRKRPYVSRNRPRRPSRTIYERNRRRSPERRRPTPSNLDEQRRRPGSGEMTNKYHDLNSEYDNDRDYYWHCIPRLYITEHKYHVEIYSNMRALSFIIALAAASICNAATPQLRFAWKMVDFTWSSPAEKENAIKENLYVPENNLPLGMVRWKNKVFVTLPKWKKGVASSLNYIDIDGPQDQKLKPYPSFKDNFVSDTASALPSNSSIISVFRLFVDACDRLWVMDSGLADILGSPHQIAGPSLVIFDLNTDQLLHRYFFKLSDMKEDSFFANVVVDVDKDTCDNAFAYVPDLGAYGVVVYSLKQDDSWRVSHHYFHFEPLAGAYNVAGIKFQWTDGVFGLALSEPRENGFRTMFFHAFSSTKEFCVSTELLRNYTHIDKSEAFHDFKLLGDRGEGTQASASYYDPKTHVLFYTQVNRDGVGCWNVNKPYTPENNPLIISDPKLYEFPNDLKVDAEGTLWLLVDKLPRFIYSKLDPNEINYSIYSISTTDAIAGTACQ